MAKVNIGDRVRIVDAVSDSYEDYGYRNGEVYEVKGFTGGEPDIWPDGTADSAIFLHEHEYEVVTEENRPTKTTAELLAEKRKEVAELEAKLRGEITVGTIAFTLENGWHDDIPAGTLVKVREVYDHGEYPIECAFLDNSDWDTFSYDQIEILTYETARARLIADVDRKLAEAFPERA